MKSIWNEFAKMFGLMDDNQKANDLNLNKTRNVRNTDIDDYNCGGYALGTFSWYRPSDNIYFDFGSRHLESIINGIENATKECVEYMLNDFKGKLRVIKTTKELKENEYAIAFRISGNRYNDFHYAKRGDNGVWYHKMGHTKIRKIKKEKVFAKTWDFGEIEYCGNLVLFAKVKD